MLTRKDFEAIAHAMATVPTPSNDAVGAWRASVYALGTMCAQSNPRFNRLKFEAACGLASRSYLPTHTGD
jgi:hypothetical protein